MHSIGIQQKNIRRYSRYILVLFVISWINLIIQAPVHAAMKQQAALSGHMNMDCHCPETLCDTVLNLEAQSSDVIHIVLDNEPGFNLAYTVFVFNAHQLSIPFSNIKNIRFSFEAGRPPPLEITRILLI